MNPTLKHFLYALILGFFVIGINYFDPITIGRATATILAVIIFVFCEIQESIREQGTQND